MSIHAAYSGQRLSLPHLPSQATAFPTPCCRLFKLYLFCAPRLFHGLWSVVRPFVDPATRDKVQFVYNNAATAALFSQDFPPQVCTPTL